MGGMLYNPAHPENMVDAVYLKVRSDGTFTESNTNLTIKMQNVLVYPNPGSNYFILECGPQILGAKLTIYDAYGIIKIQKTLYSKLETLSASELISGEYFWRIENNGKIIDKGLWIKH